MTCVADGLGSESDVLKCILFIKILTYDLCRICFGKFQILEIQVVVQELSNSKRITRFPSCCGCTLGFLGSTQNTPALENPQESPQPTVQGWLWSLESLEGVVIFGLTSLLVEGKQRIKMVEVTSLPSVVTWRSPVTGRSATTVGSAKVNVESKGTTTTAKKAPAATKRSVAKKSTSGAKASKFTSLPSVVSWMQDSRPPAIAVTGSKGMATPAKKEDPIAAPQEAQDGTSKGGGGPQSRKRPAPVPLPPASTEEGGRSSKRDRKKTETFDPDAAARRGALGDGLPVPQFWGELFHRKVPDPVSGTPVKPHILQMQGIDAGFYNGCPVEVCGCSCCLVSSLLSPLSLLPSPLSPLSSIPPPRSPEFSPAVHLTFSNPSPIGENQGPRRRLEEGLCRQCVQGRVVCHTSGWHRGDDRARGCRAP